MSRTPLDPVTVLDGEPWLHLTGEDLLVCPYEAGQHSSFAALGRRLAQLLDTLGEVGNLSNAEGELPDKIGGFQYQLIERLRSEGWEVAINRRTDRWQVKATAKVSRAVFERFRTIQERRRLAATINKLCP